MTYAVRYTRSARRALSHDLPEAVAVACIEFVGGPLASEPYRVGKPLRAPFEGLWSARRGEFRILHSVDEGRLTVLVVTVDHRRDAYRS